MQAYFESEQAFSISMPQPVFEISIAYIKNDVSGKSKKYLQKTEKIWWFWLLI